MSCKGASHARCVICAGMGECMSVVRDSRQEGDCCVLAIHSLLEYSIRVGGQVERAFNFPVPLAIYKHFILLKVTTVALLEFGVVVDCFW